MKTGEHWLEGCIVDLFTLRPVHPAFESLAPGSGFGAGVGFDSKPNAGRVESNISLKTVASVDGSFSMGGSYTLAFPGLSISARQSSSGSPPASCTASSDRPECHPYIRRLSLHAGDPEMDAKAALTFRAQHLQLNRQDYYGQGQFTSQSGWSTYSLRSNTVGMTFGDPFASWLSPSVAVDYLEPDIGGTTGEPRPSITSLYTASTTPGLALRPRFVRTEPQVWVRFQVPPNFATGKVSLVPDVTHVTLGYAFFHDFEKDQATFRQLHGFAQTSFEILILTGKTGANRGTLSKLICPARPATECSLGKLFLTADAVLSYTSSGSLVPFYFQPSLGGVDFQGEDTLRGFRDYRFRAPDRVFYQAEFRHELGKLPMGLLAFYDVGRVGNDASELSSHLRHDTGTGLYVTVANMVLLRLYVGFGTGEGIRPNLKFANGAF